VEPDRLLSTSSEGLSAKTEIEAPFFVNYGSRTLLRARTWQGKLFYDFTRQTFQRTWRPEARLTAEVNIGWPVIFLKRKKIKKWRTDF